MIEIILKHDRGRGRVELRFAPTPVAFSFGKPGIRFVTRQAFVLENHGYSDPLLEGPGKRLHRGRLLSGRPIESARPANDDGLEPIGLTSQTFDFMCQFCQRRRLRRRPLQKTPR